LYRFTGIDLFLTHDPADTREIPEDFTGWIIHSHVHNNDLDNFPFFDPENKRINVSAEVVHYQPVPLMEICRLIETGNRKLLLYQDHDPPEIAGKSRTGFNHVPD
jgi:calcineurin-like phosphoesterase family protein